jgi:hypothetical protein
MKNVSDKNCRETRSTHFMSSNVFRKSCRLWDNMEKFCRAGQAINDMAHAHCMLDTQGYKCTHRLCKSLHFYCNNGCTNAPRYVIRTLHALLYPVKLFDRSPLVDRLYWGADSTHKFRRNTVRLSSVVFTRTLWLIIILHTGGVAGRSCRFACTNHISHCRTFLLNLEFSYISDSPMCHPAWPWREWVPCTTFLWGDCLQSRHEKKHFS